MFYEAIYTRCRYGVDLIKNGQPITHDGFKVYSCSNEILEKDRLDIHFFNKEIQSHPYYSDPKFMDDAYMYYTPKVGDSFLINFHPIHFDPTVEGNFAKRGGNVINQALIGDFSSKYPYELFNNDVVWNAKNKGEAFYYSTEPESIIPRTDIEMEKAQYSFNEINNFVTDGRKDLLKKAVAFISDQFNNNASENRYLVILDENTKNVELWISAIECAFSPRMAASISFVTRMDSFINNNRIKADEMIVPVNEKEKTHFRARIVGVVSADKSNVALASKKIQNLPFILLDGIQKRMEYTCNNDEYLELITTFGDEHFDFTRSFLNTFDIKTPSENLCALLRCYRTLLNDNSDTKQFTAAIEGIGKYSIYNTEMLHLIFEKAKTKVAGILETDISVAIPVINWLQKTAGVVSDGEFEQWMEKKVIHLLKYSVFVDDNINLATKIWSYIKNSSYAVKGSEIITDCDIIHEYGVDIGKGSSKKAVLIADVFSEAYKFLRIHDEKPVEYIAEYCSMACATMNDFKALNSISEKLCSLIEEEKTNFWIKIAKKNDTRDALFIIEYIIQSEKHLFSSEKNIIGFCKMLVEEGYSVEIIPAIKRYILSLDSADKRVNCIKLFERQPFISDKERLMLYKIVDDTLDVSSKDMVDAANILQENKPKNYAFPNSAHIMALYFISNKRRKSDITDNLKVYSKQGFPSVNNSDYINAVVSSILKVNLDDDEIIYLIKRFLTQPEKYYKSLLNSIIPYAPNYKDYWNHIINVSAGIKDQNLYNQAYIILAEVLADSKQPKKLMTLLERYINTKEGLDFYKKAVKKADNIIDAQPKTKGIFGMFRK